MTRQYRRLTRIKLRTPAQKRCPPDFMARLIMAYSAHPWRRNADASIVHSCQRWAGNCACSFCRLLRQTATPARWSGSISKRIPSAAWRRPVKENFAKKVCRSLRELQNDARKILSFFPKPSLKYVA